MSAALHHSEKAFQRLSLAIWRVLQRLSAFLGDGVAALDTTGWERSYASRYYTQRINLKIRALKTTLLVDTGAQTVLDVHVTTRRTHDTQIAPQLTERNLERFRTLVADKGYDDGAHRHWLTAWGKRHLIKHREFAPYDKAANARMDEKIYHKRSLVETVISVMKRKYGNAVSSRVWWRQFRELVAMCLVYNLERAVQLGVTLFVRLLRRLLYFVQQRISTELANSIIPLLHFHLGLLELHPKSIFLTLGQCDSELVMLSFINMNRLLDLTPIWGCDSHDVISCEPAEGDLALLIRHTLSVGNPLFSD